MQIKNTGKTVRTVSHRGSDHTLTPGAWAEVLMTGDEAEAFRGLGFQVTGEPERVEPSRKVKAS